MNLNFVVFEKRMIKSWLVRDVNTIYNIPIRALYMTIQNKTTTLVKSLDIFTTTNPFKKKWDKEIY